LQKLFLLIFVFNIVLFFCSPIQKSDYQSIQSDPLLVSDANNNVIKLKLYLIEKYNPGDCFGMPSIRNPRDRANINPELLVKVKELLKNKTDKEYDDIIRQMNNIRIEQVQTNEYNFFFKDGKCCTIINYKGRLLILSDNIYESNTITTTEEVPC